MTTNAQRHRAHKREAALAAVDALQQEHQALQEAAWLVLRQRDQAVVEALQSRDIAVRDVAGRLGCSKQAVYAMIRRAFQYRRPPLPLDDAERAQSASPAALTQASRVGTGAG